MQYEAGLIAYMHQQLNLPIASTAPLAKITDAFSAGIRRFARDQEVPWVDFVKGQRKDDIMHAHLAAFEAAGRTEGVLFIGRAHGLFRTERRRNAEGKTYPWIVRSTEDPQPGSLVAKHPDLLRPCRHRDETGQRSQHRPAATVARSCRASVRSPGSCEPDEPVQRRLTPVEGQGPRGRGGR